jgi:hypothetical protein
MGSVGAMVVTDAALEEAGTSPHPATHGEQTTREKSPAGLVPGVTQAPTSEFHQKSRPDLTRRSFLKEKKLTAENAQHHAICIYLA